MFAGRARAVLSNRPEVVRSEARMRVLAVMTSEGNGGGGFRDESRVSSHV